MKSRVFALMLPLLAACGGEQNASAPTVQASAAVAPADARYSAGRQVYEANCRACHGADGQGLTAAIPPLAQADYLNDKNAAIRAVVKGINGKITVNGKDYEGIMPATVLSDEDTAAVLEYVYNHFGNSGGTVSAAEVAAVRAEP